MKRAIKMVVACAAVWRAMSLASAQGPDEQVTFDVSAQPLAEALTQLALQADLRLAYYTAVGQGLRAPAVIGKYTPAAALQLLLKSTSLRAEFVDAHTVLIRSDADENGSSSRRRADSAGENTASALSNAHLASLGNDQGVISLTVLNEASSVAAGNSASELAEVVVTGTHIAGAPTPSPVLTIGREDIEHSGYTSTGDLLRSIPENFSGGNSPQVMSQGAPGDSYAPSFGSAPNLRGLGPGSTLTLVNGHRLAQDAPSGATDISLLPLDAIERIEVVTDGASAIYGSDAVAGVVNIILRDKFNGARSSATIAKATEGGALEKRFSQLVGGSWQSGSALLTYERDSQDAVDATQRSFTATSNLPYDLLPQTSRNSFVGTVRERPTETVSLFGDGLYTSRRASFVQTHVAPNSLSNLVEVKQYQVTGGLTVHLPAAWNVTAFQSFASDRSTSDRAGFQVGVPGDIPYSAETITGRTRSFEVNADGPLVNLSAGPIRVAVGAGYRHETFDDVDALSGPVSGGARSVKYAFGELAIPIISPANNGLVRHLDLNVSGRFERYSDFGSTAVPKIGLVLVPVDALKLRASWNKSFRAPSLADVDGLLYGTVFELPDPLSPTGMANAMVSGGGNAALGPETARSWTTGFEYSPEWLADSQISATYFDITYTNRIGALSTIDTALTDPANAPLVTRNPSASALAALLNAPGGCYNTITGNLCAPTDPVDVIINGGPVNIAQQHINGADLGLQKRIRLGSGQLELVSNGTYLQFRNRLTSSLPVDELAGRAFSPPRFRARGGETWSTPHWSETVMVNFVSSGINLYQPDRPHVASWTTADAQVAFHSGPVRAFRDLEAALSVQNIFDKDPPYVLYDFYRQGLHYDSLNCSPLGRFVSLRVTVTF